MLAVSDAFFQSETLTYAAAAIALLVAALFLQLILLLNFRRAFPRRLRAPETGNAGRLMLRAAAFLMSRQRSAASCRPPHSFCCLSNSPVVCWPSARAWRSAVRGLAYKWARPSLIS